MFRTFLLLMIALEAVSLTSFVFGGVSLFLLAGIGLAVFIISLKRLEWGIYILFGELFLGSRGHLLEYGFVSLRLVVFVAVFLGWIITEYQKSKIKNQKVNEKFKIFKELPIIYWLLLIIIVLGGIYGYLRGNGIEKVFFDANGYLYLAILPAVLSGIRSQQALNNLFKILGAAILVIAGKTLILFLWFSYGFFGVATLYRWVIEWDIGEITGAVGSASRIFMQSQFWALVGLFIFALREQKNWLIISAAMLAVILSLSRSLWLGGIAAAIFLGAVWFFYFKAGFGKLLKLGLAVVLIAAFEISGLYCLSLFGGGFSESVTSRGINPGQEAAGSARLMLLPELLQEIGKAPLAGAGFGKELSYSSYLPDKVTPENPEGKIMTYAFEWGYLDTWLKIGFLGLVVYLLFIARILGIGIQNAKFKMQNLGILAGIVALVVLNITTPYLNHPLGIGYLILALVTFRHNANIAKEYANDANEISQDSHKYS